MTHKLAGTPVQEQDIIDVQTLVDAYFDNAPDITDPTQLVSFGTSGHRGTSLNGTFPVCSRLENIILTTQKNIIS